MSRKLIVVLVALVSAFSVSLGLAANAQVTLTVSDWPKENAPDALKTMQGYAKTMLDKYNVVVKGDEYAYAVDSFLPKAAAGTIPTVYITWFTEPGKIIDAGFAKDITAEMKETGLDKAMNPQLLKILSKNGKIYGVAKDGYYQGLVCNVDLFKKAGLVDKNGVPLAPKSYADLIKTAQTIKAKTGAAGFIMETANNCGGWHFMNIAWSFGVNFETKKNGKWVATFNSPEGVAALNYIKDLKWKYKVLPATATLDWSSGQQTLATGQGAMMFFNGNNHGGFDFMEDQFKVTKDQVAIFSMPAGPKGRYTQFGGSVYMFSPKATHEQVLAGLKWLEVQGFSPAVTEESLAADDNAFQQDVINKRFIGAAGFQVWTSKERQAAMEKIRAKYINVPTGMFSDYNNFSQVTLRPEEPVACQDLYKALDVCIQTVLSDEKANAKALLDTAAAGFQKDFLDKAQ